MLKMRLKYTKYAELKLFMVVSLLIGATLWVVQDYGILNRFDMLFFNIDSTATYTAVPVAVSILIVMFFTLFPGVIILEEGIVKGVMYTTVAWFFYAILIHSYIGVFHFLMPLSAPLLGTILALIRVLGWESSLHEEEKNSIRKTFNCFVEPSVASMAINNPDLLNEGGIRKTVTVMFADLRGSTKLCETVEPELLITILRECFSKLIATARSNGGTIDKLIGDSLMVVWGNPLTQPDHAERAVEAATEMQLVMGSLKTKWQRKLGIDIDLGIGINTAEVVVGTIGSQEYCDYTVLGYGVNLASRIQSTCPGGEIYVSATTRGLLSNQDSFKRLGMFNYKNVSRKVEIYKYMSPEWVRENVIKEQKSSAPIDLQLISPCV